MDCPSCGASTPQTKPFCSECGASLPPAPRPAGARPVDGGGDAADASTRFAPYKPDALETGTTFAGRHQIIEELGRGGPAFVRDRVGVRELRGSLAEAKETTR